MVKCAIFKGFFVLSIFYSHSFLFISVCNCRFLAVFLLEFSKEFLISKLPKNDSKSDPLDL